MIRERLRNYVRHAKEEEPKLFRLSSFTLKLLFAGLIFRSVIFLDPETVLLRESLASVTISILEPLGYSFSQQGALLVGEPDSYLITRDCLGWKSVAAFIGLVFASSKQFLKELKIVALGSALLLAVNIVRIVSTVILAEAGVISFDIIHTFLWRWGMTAIVFAVWYGWFTR